MFLRLSTLILAQLLDLVTFDVMVHRVGPEAEANPFVSDLFLAAGMPAVAVAKIALILLVGSLVVGVRSRGAARLGPRRRGAARARDLGRFDRRHHERRHIPQIVGTD